MRSLDISGDEDSLAREIVAFAEGAQVADLNDGVNSFFDALDQGWIKVSPTGLENQTNPAYLRKGTMVVVNLTKEEQNICLPYASAYKDEERMDVQEMAVYPDQQPDPKDVEEPELLPEPGGHDRAPLAWAMIMPVVAVLVGGLELWLRRPARARRRVE